MKPQFLVLDSIDIDNIVELMAKDLVEYYKQTGQIKKEYEIPYKGMLLERRIYDYIDKVLDFFNKYGNDLKVSAGLNADRLIEKLNEYKFSFDDL